MERPERARIYLQQALALQPHSAAVLMECAKLETMLGNDELAGEFAQRAEAADAKSSTRSKSNSTAV